MLICFNTTNTHKDLITQKCCCFIPVQLLWTLSRQYFMFSIWWRNWKNSLVFISILMFCFSFGFSPLSTSESSTISWIQLDPKIQNFSLVCPNIYSVSLTDLSSVLQKQIQLPPSHWRRQSLPNKLMELFLFLFKPPTVHWRSSSLDIVYSTQSALQVTFCGSILFVLYTFLIISIMSSLISLKYRRNKDLLISLNISHWNVKFRQVQFL